jgi:hypothetical protein
MLMGQKRAKMSKELKEWRKAPWICLGCREKAGRPCENSKKDFWDRIDPHHVKKAKAGEPKDDSPGNLVPLCRMCHATLESALKNGDEAIIAWVKKHKSAPDMFGRGCMSAIDPEIRERLFKLPPIPKNPLIGNAEYIPEGEE